MTAADRVPLTRERIIDAALAFVDANGLEALSMRKLGGVLGVEAMSLYNHVDNKDDVLDGVLDRVLREVPLPDPSLVWTEQLRVLARGFRAAGLAHPGVLPMFGSRTIGTVEGFAPLEVGFAVLRDAGLDAGAALDALLTLSSFVLGRVVLDMGALQPDGGIDLTAADATDHPSLAELVQAANVSDGTREFEHGFDILIEGLRLLVERADDAS